MTDEWKRSSVIDSGNYPKTNFKGVLKAIYPTYNEKLNGHVLQLDFEEGQTYSMPLNAKEYGLHEDGSVDGFLAIGKFINSLEKIDINTGEVNMNNTDPAIKRIETFWAWLNGEPAGFKTEPDIIGCTLYNVANVKEIGDSEQTAKAAKWPEWTIGKIEGLQANKPAANKPASKPQSQSQAKGTGKPAASPKTEAPAQVDDDLSDLLLETLTTAMSPGEIYTALGKKYKVKDLRIAITALGAALKQIGDKPNEKYQVA